MQYRLPMLALLPLLVSLTSGTADAGFQPIGGHYAPMNNASGYASGSVSPTGRYRAAVPLDLPVARGGLPVPLAVVYDGGNRIGEAGLGWSIPYSFVHRSTSLSRRKPVHASGTATPAPAERVFLNLGGESLLMNPTGAVPSHTGATATHRAFVADGYLELVQPYGGLNIWLARDPAGREYVFSPIAGLEDRSRWFLTEIRDRSGNKVTLKYPPVVTVPGTSFKELLLTEVAYSHDSTGACPKHRVELIPDVPEFVPANTILGYSLDHGHVLVRTKLVKQIRIWSLDYIRDWSNIATSCVGREHELIRTYEFFYRPDTDTGLPRLARVELGGQGSTGPTLPVVSFTYGSTNIPGLGLVYGPVESVPLPVDVPGDVALAASNESNFRTRRMLADFTGDGLPDFIYPEGSESSGTLTLARNVTDKAGTSLNATTSLNAIAPLFANPDLAVADLVREEFGPTSASTAFDDRLQTYIQVVDWNGDDRLDIVDAKGGKDPATGRPSPDYWRLLLNVPTAATDPRANWHERHINVAALRDRLAGSGYLPVAQKTSGWFWQRETCWRYVEDGEHWKLIQCRLDDGQLEHVTTRPGSTITEWKLLDMNGDGFPDLVFNAQPAQFMMNRDQEESVHFIDVHCKDRYLFSERNDPDCPIPVGGRFPAIDREWVDIRPDNEIRVFYNINGGGLTHSGSPLEFATSDVPLHGPTQCGLERWRERFEDWDRDGRIDDARQWMQCGFVEVNGDGLVDYVTQELKTGELSSIPGALVIALLNTGVPGGFIGGSSFRLPGPPIQVNNGQRVTCQGPTTYGSYNVRHLAALTDLNGDGIPDYVQWNSRAGVWEISSGTGAGYSTVKSIHSPNVEFELSLTEGTCGGELSKTVAGLVDMDGDGRPDVVRAITSTASVPAHLQVARLVGIDTGAPEAGRLTGVSNGYGATTVIRYGSAKVDTRTPHQVPFPEIVVTEVRQLAAKSLGTPIDPVRYAYGYAQLLYQPLLARWGFPGYGRHVVLRGTPAFDNYIWGTAYLYDSIRPGELIQGYENYALAGRIRDVRYVTGGLEDDPGILLNLQVEYDSRWKGNAHITYKTVLIPAADDVNPASHDCHDIDLSGYVTAPATWAGAQQLCRKTGIVYRYELSSWSGDEAPSAAKTAVETRTTVAQVDGYAQPRLVVFENDSARADDDVCLHLTYAAASPVVAHVRTGAPVLDAVHTERLTNCRPRKDGEVIHAGMRYRYDDLVEGQVDKGLLTHRIVERYDPRTGTADAYILDATTYDGFGNPKSVTMAREDGVTLIRKLYFDDFGVRVKQVVESSGSADLLTAVDFDARSRLLTTIDSNSVQLRTYYDSFWRPISSTVVTYPDKVESLLSTTEYLGDNPGDPQGRRIRSRTFHAGRDPGSRKHCRRA
jgi:hypothetical protein